MCKVYLFRIQCIVKINCTQKYIEKLSDVKKRFQKFKVNSHLLTVHQLSFIIRNDFQKDISETRKMIFTVGYFSRIVVEGYIWKTTITIRKQLDF